jgi:hypothetical protein
MSPINRPSRRRRFVLAGVGVAGAAALVGGGLLATGAYFTSQATVDGQGVTTASVKITADTAAASAPITAGSLLPGDTKSTSIDLKNTGSEDVYYTISLPKAAGGDADLESAIEVKVTVGSASETHTLTDWQDGALQIGPALAADTTQPVKVELTLPAGADDDLQGTDAAFAVQVDAIQARNTTAPTAGWVAD